VALSDFTPMKILNDWRSAPLEILSKIHCGASRRTWRDVPGPSERQSAVLVPFFTRRDDLFLLFVERSFSLRRHPGQIAFPGGVREEGDLGPEETALREFEEETGISSDSVEILGALQEERAYSSDFLLYPVAGFIDREISISDLVPDPVEVKRLIEVPFREIAVNPRMENFVRGGDSFQYPVFLVDGDVRIWGATAWILWRLIQKLEEGSGSPECL